MKKKLCLFVLICIFAFKGLHAQENFKIMFYNVLNFPLEDAVPNRLQYLEAILDDYRPDIFMVCELNNINGAQTILNSLQFLNPNIESAIFELNTSDDNISDQNDLQNLIYYDSSKFILESQTIVTSIYRDFNHYRMKINSLESDTNPVFIDFIVCHLKASSGTENQALRLQMVEDLVAYLDALPSDSNVVLAGDFNVYTHSEPAFQELIDTDNNNNIDFIDPADQIGSWHNNTSYIEVMTQSTRTQTGFGGATGGFDDRFDFILTSENMQTNPEIKFVENSYKVFGNNANVQCYNQAINSSDCSGADYSSFIRNALHNFSDHLPVTLELQTNQTLSLEEFTTLSAMQFVGSNVINNTLMLKLNPLAQLKTVTINNSLGQVIKTITVKNSLYIEESMSSMSNGIYYITSQELQNKPLKFIVAH
ncbi:endonuclease/exonuclease/phosphatase family protein [Psychroserpens ponticola]|uniref:Endonuclease/exonuclease/phosphatase family protein n=1 Tax=Psychroserpens ponticola TaxID=2932268 RepID=A0ABY7S4X4_9FLAO|nr:endonuclease/exonuclease/phosphatase family protein [Psychroserpens ponticola]WCO02955.1 endonuclease/exonuclease/phosphatase family protein [Psychroserpens ponticola]